jgi:hypothetical protein
MEDKRNALWQSTENAHCKIQQAAFCLESIAREVSYLHPRLADELELLADTIEKSRKTIQYDAAEMINLKLKNSQRFVGEMFEVLLKTTEVS